MCESLYSPKTNERLTTSEKTSVYICVCSLRSACFFFTFRVYVFYWFFEHRSLSFGAGKCFVDPSMYKYTRLLFFVFTHSRGWIQEIVEIVKVEFVIKPPHPTAVPCVPIFLVHAVVFLGCAGSIIAGRAGDCTATRVAASERCCRDRSARGTRRGYVSRATPAWLRSRRCLPVSLWNRGEGGGVLRLCMAVVG